ncbi:PHP domain-containing protein [candidate division CSSED10-310 bacterium]|uniref:PHP domain-containing protein n=1 Tax=candidate division CSSED10-310 bacterium TaxID=2855610 RepID=A0ABV6YZI6_UNCC1
MLLKGALHIHTTCSDGDMNMSEVVEIYAALGFDFIAITDHDFLLPRACQESTIYDQQSGLIIFQGLELTIFEKGYLHVNKIEGDREVLHIFNHPSELDLPVEKVIQRIEAVARKVPLDAVEVTSKGFYTAEYDISEIRYPKVATDDAHTRQGCGRAWIEMDCKASKDSIIRAIKRGNFWNCFNT